MAVVLRGIRQWSVYVDACISSTCASIALVVATAPKKTIALSLVFTLISCSGFANVTTVEHAENLYTPQDTRSFDDNDWINDLFGDQASQSAVFFERHNRAANVLTKEALSEVFDVHEYILAINSKGGKYSYSKSCERAYWQPGGEEADKECQSESVLAYWDYNRTKMMADPDILATVAAEGVADCCSPISRTIVRGRVIAKLRYDESGVLVGAGSLKARYYLATDLHDKSLEDPDVLRLEKKFSRRLRRRLELDNFQRLTTLTSANISENVDNAFDNDQLLINAAFIALLVYSFFALYDRSSRGVNESRGCLGLQAVFVVLLSVVAAFGVALGSGIDFSPAQTIVVFLVLGIGLDDVFVICGADRNFGRFDQDVDSIVSGARTVAEVAVRRTVVTMASAGPSITITSLTDFCAFIAGSFTRIPAIQAFCVLSATAVLVDFLFQTTLFVALFSMDMERKLKRAVDRKNGLIAAGGCCCCKSITCSKVAAVDDAKEQEAPAVVIIATPSIPAPPSETLKGLSPLVFVKAETQTAVRRMRAECDTLESEKNWFGGSYARALLSPAGMLFATVVTGGLFFMGVYGVTRVTIDFRYDWFIVGGTVRSTWDFNEKHYSSSNTQPCDLYTKDADYFAEADSMDRLLAEYSKKHWVIASSLEPNWYTGHRDWASASPPTTSDAYLQSVKDFLATPEGSGYRQLVAFNSEGNIVGTKISGSWTNDKDDDGLTDKRRMQKSRRLIHKVAPAVHPVVNKYDFIWTESSVIVIRETLRSMAIACITVGFVLITLLGDIPAALLVAMNVTIICLVTFSAIFWYNQYCNAVSSFFIVIAVGLATDASAHVTHAFLKQRQPTRRERAAAALNDLGPSVFLGGTSTLVAMVVIAFCQTYIFRTFFYFLTTIIVLSLWFGLVAMPVTLALFGPMQHDQKEEVPAPGKETGKESSLEQAIASSEEGTTPQR